VLRCNGRGEAGDSGGVKGTLAGSGPIREGIMMNTFVDDEIASEKGWTRPKAARPQQGRKWSGGTGQVGANWERGGETTRHEMSMKRRGALTMILAHRKGGLK